MNKIIYNGGQRPVNLYDVKTTPATFFRIKPKTFEINIST